MRKLALAAIIMFSLGTVACGGKASEEQCKKVATNMIDIQLAKSKIPKAALEQARKAASAGIEDISKKCQEGMTGAQADCVGSAKDMAAVQACK